MTALPASTALVIGEALIDLIDRGGTPQPVVGGSPLNVAVGLSRLAVPSTLSTDIGDDAYGAMIVRHLEANDVGLVPGSISTTPTSLARATIGADGAARYDFDIHWDLAEEPGGTVLAQPPVVVHTGSIAAVLEPGASVVQAELARLRSVATISYDPNVRPALMGEPGVAVTRIESIVAAADVVKASDEDLDWLYPGVDLMSVARRWRELGAGLVVVTRGELGAHAVAREATLDVPAPQVAVVDTIGAGDSFMAGLLAALAARGLAGRAAEAELRAIDEQALREVVEFAAASAAITVSRVGADPPTLDEVRRTVASG